MNSSCLSIWRALLHGPWNDVSERFGAAGESCSGLDCLLSLHAVYTRCSRFCGYKAQHALGTADCATSCEALARTGEPSPEATSTLVSLFRFPGALITLAHRTPRSKLRRTGLAELFVCICVDARRARSPRSVSFQFHLVCLRRPQHPSASSASAPLVCTPPRQSLSAASQVLYNALRPSFWPRTANMA